MKSPFRRDVQDDETDAPEQFSEHAQAPRTRPQREQRLMFEATTHWARGMWIIVGMVATVIAFLVILQVLPKPGNGNPIDALTNSNTNTQSVATLAKGGTSTAVALATVTAAASPGPAGTGTPSGTFFGAARAGSAPNVRPAPSTNNTPVGQLAPGRQVEVIGRSADNAWLQIVWDNNQKAWVAADLITLTGGNANQLPVVH
ncbi:MAG TPA: SH3 domain-containing protein [Dehalococcoidia bacterium]|nr:SH3 domain-containing protein [Dehalococcoidia bacterium]